MSPRGSRPAEATETANTEMSPGTALPRSERWIPLVFALVVALLPIQYWFAKVNSRGEPYPALLMPAFEGTQTDRHGLASGESVTIVVSFEDGTESTVPLRMLFARAKSSQIMAMAHIALKPKPAPPIDRSTDSASLREFLKRHVVPGLPLSTARINYWSGPDPLTVEWLRARMRELFPGRRAIRVTVGWSLDTYAWQADRWIRQRTGVLSLDVPL